MSEERNTQHPDPATPGTATQAPPRTAPRRPRPQQLPPFKLLLHNDDVNTTDHVVRAILELTPLNPAQAVRRMLEAHLTGVALLLVTHQERGELYVQQFASCHITTSLEPDC